jgi:NAD(P)-dependent dehydrogenase (short-subunit alcohol dehydrogenase family)
MGVVDGKAVIVTGGAGVLGRAYCRALAHEGAAVLISDIAAERAQALAGELRAAGARVAVDDASVASWDGAEAVVERCLREFGRLDGVVASAHTTRFGPIWELRERDLDATLASHVKGHFACVHHAARAMRAQRSGSIVTVGSRALNGLPGVSCYAAAKGAILSATFSWALELADSGIRVNCINPAAELSGGTPARHMKWHWDFSIDKPGWSEPVPAAESVAPLVVYLLCDDSDWVTGQVIFLSGDTLALLRHPREERFAFRPEGWSVLDLRRHFRETIGASLEMPGMGVPHYRWYGGVK